MANFGINISVINNFDNRNSHALLKTDSVPGNLITLSILSWIFKPYEGLYPFK